MLINQVAMMMDYENDESCLFDNVLNLCNTYDVECGRNDTVRETNRRYRKSNSTSHKIVHVEIDPARKSDREEWGTSHYHRYYNPMAAFELTVEWLVATGMILSDLVRSWFLRSNQFGFHFVPVPGDPFALPFTANSDPLRGPIFVPLNIKCLMEQEEGEAVGGEKRELFDEFPLESRGERLALFQENILKRFGFMRDICPLRRALCVAKQNESPPQYVHRTGGMFATFLSATTTEVTNSMDVMTSSMSANIPTVPSLQQRHRDFIAHQCKEQTTCSDDCRHVGFHWVWNFMLTKRWRSSVTGDELFQDKVFSDFRKFCDNSEGRLKEYWNELKQTSVKSRRNTVTREGSEDRGLTMEVNTVA